MSLPANPIEAYKSMIDHFVNKTRCRGRGALLKKTGEFYRNDERYNEFVRSLSPGQKELLSDLLKSERDGAIHDLLADMTWWITTRKVGLTYDRQPMPDDLGEMGLHYDYASRCQGLEWPE